MRLINRPGRLLSSSRSEHVNFYEIHNFLLIIQCWTASELSSPTLQNFQFPQKICIFHRSSWWECRAGCQTRPSVPSLKIDIKSTAATRNDWKNMQRLKLYLNFIIRFIKIEKKCPEWVRIRRGGRKECRLLWSRLASSR